MLLAVHGTNRVIIHETAKDFNAYFIDFTKSVVIFFKAPLIFRQKIVNSSQIPGISMSFSEKHLYLLWRTFYDKSNPEAC